MMTGGSAGDRNVADVPLLSDELGFSSWRSGFTRGHETILVAWLRAGHDFSDAARAAGLDPHRIPYSLSVHAPEILGPYAKFYEQQEKQGLVRPAPQIALACSREGRAVQSRPNRWGRRSDRQTGR